MIVSSMLMTMILSSLIVNSIATSKRGYTCYICHDCKKFSKYTLTELGCGACTVR
uniref:Uncharacterized protein n=1 Tax=Trichobilharzia regenti TaxID=157069 RepID=A0AA85J856_TRIRE|nr:unnamed protein product [Trichobilharzia regenti]